MIDHLEKQTQSLPLEQKRGRGRPSTGQALSNAERQRLYRERQKAQRNENMHKEVAEDLRAELAKAVERIEELESELKRWKKLATAAERARQVVAEELTKRNEKSTDDKELYGLIEEAKKQEQYWMERALQAEKRLAQRNEKPGDPMKWALQRQSPKGQWRTVVKYETAAEANISLAEQAGEMQHMYRVRALK